MAFHGTLDRFVTIADLLHDYCVGLIWILARLTSSKIRQLLELRKFEFFCEFNSSVWLHLFRFWKFRSGLLVIGEMAGCCFRDGDSISLAQSIDEHLILDLDTLHFISIRISIKLL